MFDVNKAIYACDDVICRNIESFTTEQRGLLSQNILSQLRNFVENIFVKVYISLGGEPQRCCDSLEKMSYNGSDSLEKV